MTSKRLFRPLLALILVGAGLSGCASMPLSGDPQAFPIETEAPDQIGQTGFGPQLNSTPDQLVRDFLRACAAGASSNDYATARLYLMPLVASEWRPDLGTLVYPNDEILQTSESGVSTVATTVTLDSRIRASVDESGVFTDTDGTSTQVVFDMVLDEDGQWRINRLADGVILAQTSFVAAFQPVQLYFLSADRESLIPDPRWYPKKNLSSHLMMGLLGGPSEQLAPAVFSELQAMQLPTQGVEVTDQTILVDLAGDLPATKKARTALAWQVNATLAQARNAPKIEITVDSVALDAVEIPVAQGLQLDTAVGISEGAIVDSDGDSWRELVATELVGAAPSFPARGPVESYVTAWINGGDQLAIRQASGQVSRTVLASPSPPSVDSWGWVWTSTDGTDGSILAVDGGGESISLELPNAMQADVQKLAVSPDGTRISFKISGPEGARMWMGIVVRNVSGRPLAIQQLEQVTQAGRGVIDFSWSGPVNLVVLRGEGEGELEMVQLPLSGFPQVSKVPAGVTRIASGSLSSRLYLQTADNQTFFRRGTFWPKLDQEIEYISFTG